MADIARECGVSTATVSYVLNNSPRKMRAQTREKVQDAIQRLNYSPNAMARGLNGKAVNTLGVVILNSVQSPLDDPYYRPILSGIIDEATDNQKSMNLFNGNIWASERENQLQFCDGRCDGLLVFLPTIGNNVIAALKNQPIPFVVIGEGGTDDSVSSIDIDNIAAARAVTKFLISHGHTRIACIEGDVKLQSTYDRLQGYREALEECGITYDASLVLPGIDSIDSGYDRTCRMLSQQGVLPTAIAVYNDLTAYAAMEAVQALGKRVPEDVSVVGIDGIEPPKHYPVLLTTASQNLRVLGLNAAKLLIEQLKPDSEGARKIVHPFELKIGTSVLTL